MSRITIIISKKALAKTLDDLKKVINYVKT